MKNFTITLTIFFYTLSSAPLWAANCTKELEKENSVSSKTCENKNCKAKRRFQFKTFNSSKSKAYAAIFTAMVGTSTLAALLSSLLNDNSPAMSYFFAIFLGQMSTFGTIVIGAPIWEPLQSKIRALAYKTTGHHQAADEEHDLLEQQYYTTNRKLSLNSQMTRNIFRDYIKTVTQSLYDAKKAAKDEEFEYIAAQIAEVVVRLNLLYPDVNPFESIVINAVKTAFTDFISNPESYIPLVLQKTKELDPNFDYSEIIQEWLTKSKATEKEAS